MSLAFCVFTLAYSRETHDSFSGNMPAGFHSETRCYATVNLKIVDFDIVSGDFTATLQLLNTMRPPQIVDIIHTGKRYLQRTRIVKALLFYKQR